MALTVGALIVGAGVGFGADELIQGFNKAPSSPDQAALPNTVTAEKNAQATVANQRQILLAAGGQTDYTGGFGVLTGTDVSKSTLVGG